MSLWWSDLNGLETQVFTGLPGHSGFTSNSLGVNLVSPHTFLYLFISFVHSSDTIHTFPAVDAMLLRFILGGELWGQTCGKRKRSGNVIQESNELQWRIASENFRLVRIEG